MESATLHIQETIQHHNPQTVAKAAYYKIIVALLKNVVYLCQFRENSGVIQKSQFNSCFTSLCVLIE